MSYRAKIVELAEWWAEPGVWKPSADDLVGFFYYAGAEAWPTKKEAQDALAAGGTGVKVQGQVKHWCGVFACYLIRDAGSTLIRWTLFGGKMKNIKFVYGTSGIQPGDIAVITKAQHHFIVTGINSSTKTLRTVEGNTTGQLIRVRTDRKISEPYGYYQIPE